MGSVTSILMGVKNVAVNISAKVTPLSAGKSFKGVPVRLARRLWISLG
jgi:hypothetical protein